MQRIIGFYFFGFLWKECMSFQTWSNCGGKIDVPGVGRVTSPHYPQNYPRDINCKWTITTTFGHGLRLEIEDLDNKELSSSTPYCFDTLDISQLLPSGKLKPIAPRLCASSPSDLAATTFTLNTTSTNGATTVIITFVSDYQMERKGFSILFKTMCDRTLHGQKGSITSPAYPSLYPADANCTTTILTPPGTYINLIFEQFHLHLQLGSRYCRHDYVIIATGHKGSSDYQNCSDSSPCCGANKPGPLLIHSNEVSVMFISDSQLDGIGFKAIWSAEPIPAISTAITSSIPFSTTYNMNGATSGVIKSSSAKPENITQAVYSGTCSSTISGLKCQRWDVTEPHEPKYAPSPNNHNYCRSANDDKRPWCYTQDNSIRWEYCDVSNCLIEQVAVISSPSLLQPLSSSIVSENTHSTPSDSRTSPMHTQQVLRTMADKDRIAIVSPLSFIILALIILILIVILICIVKFHKRKQSLNSNSAEQIRYCQGEIYFNTSDPQNENVYVEIPFLPLHHSECNTKMSDESSPASALDNCFSVMNGTSTINETNISVDTNSLKLVQCSELHNSTEEPYAMACEDVEEGTENAEALPNLEKKKTSSENLERGIAEQEWNVKSKICNKDEPNEETWYASPTLPPYNSRNIVNLYDEPKSLMKAHASDAKFNENLENSFTCLGTKASATNLSPHMPQKDNFQFCKKEDVVGDDISFVYNPKTDYSSLDI